MKWTRAKKWDDQHLTGWLLPIKYLLRALSSITLAVVLLALLACYGILASVPVGLIAMIPSWLLFATPLLLAIAGAVYGCSLVATRLAREGIRRLGVFALLSVASTVLVVVAFAYLAWPYHPGSGHGLVLFSDFVEHYKSTTVRRLPGMEMSELEFYAWWPLNTILYLFVINMIVATVRRIAVTFENLGVLTVHTGIVTLALGSAFYASGKQEGDTLLVAGQAGPDGTPTMGDPVDYFFDNTRTAITVRQAGRPEQQRPIDHLPRYNDYNIQALAGEVGAVAQPSGAPAETGGALNIGLDDVSFNEKAVDPDIKLRIVGYASYAELRDAWRMVGPGKARWTPRPLRPGAVGAAGPAGGGALAAEATPVRFIKLIERTNPQTNAVYKGEEGVTPVERVRQETELLPTVAAERLSSQFEGLLQVEYTRGMSEERWQTLGLPIPENTQHALVVEIPDQGLVRIQPIGQGRSFAVGNPAWTITVQEILARPKLNIITPGYEGATSSQLILQVVPPAQAVAAGTVPAKFERHLYHRFPEIAQDLTEGNRADGRPERKPASPAIKLSYIDASVVQVYLDEVVAEGGATGVSANAEPTVRALLRMPGSARPVISTLSTGQRVSIGPPLAIELGERYADAERVKVPVVVPDVQRQKDAVGTHKRAAVAVEVSTDGSGPGGVKFARTVWLPHVVYFSPQADMTTVALPDGRSVGLAFNRLRRPLPDMMIRLRDFEMIPYPHSTQPQDYRSDVVVYRGPGTRPMAAESRFIGFDRAVEKFKTQGSVELVSRSTSMNEPLLQSPHIWSDARGAMTNFASWMNAVFGVTNFKFSQAGWDSDGWMQTRAAAERGELKRPFARYTILGVGNNPGIYVVVIGAVLTVMGIPWAFYVKPWLVRRKKVKIQRLLAEGKWEGAGGRRSGKSGGELAAGGNGEVVGELGGGLASGTASALAGADGRGDLADEGIDRPGTLSVGVQR